jgi:hypothetical protein
MPFASGTSDMIRWLRFKTARGRLSLQEGDVYRCPSLRKGRLFPELPEIVSMTISGSAALVKIPELIDEKFECFRKRFEEER